jgi:hypothetical protein
MAREAQMKPPEDTAIARTKLHEYLLRHRDEDDKSGFLALAGYTLDNADRLMHDMRTQLLPLDAEFFDQTEYGPKYRIRGTLTGEWTCSACRVHLDERGCDRGNKVCYTISR